MSEDKNINKAPEMGNLYVAKKIGVIKYQRSNFGPKNILFYRSNLIFYSSTDRQVEGVMKIENLVLELGELCS